MLDTIASIMISIAVTVPLLSIVWIWRSTKQIGSASGIFSIFIFAFTLWHYYAAGTGTHHDPMHEIITALFVLATACMNVYCGTNPQVDVNIGINRRKKQNETYDSPVDRRRGNSAVLKKDN